MNSYQTALLKELRDLYGETFQVMVCIEELNELACVLCKYPRYDDPTEAKQKLHDKILDEYTDVTIILDHVKNIFNLSDEECEKHREAKIQRIQRWVNAAQEGNNTPQQTLIDRVVQN